MLNTRATDIENIIPDITNLATNAALITKAAKVESNIPEITNLPNKAALNTKAAEIKSKMLVTAGFTTMPEFYRLTKINFGERIKKAGKSFASKSQVDNTLDITDKNRKKNFGKSYFDNDPLFNIFTNLQYFHKASW